MIGGRIPPRSTGELLAAALSVLAATAGCAGAVTVEAEHPWFSATFDGATHRLRLAAPAGRARARWLASLPTCEIALDGHVVAEVTIATEDTESAIIAVLTIVDV